MTTNRSPQGRAAASIEATLARFPEAPIDHDNLAYYEGLAASEVRVNRCRACGAWHHPPRHRCPHCWSGDVVAERVETSGRVELITVLHLGPAADVIDYERGHALAAVRLDGVPGVRLTGPVVGVPPHLVEVGMAVVPAVEDRGGVPTLVFRPEPGAGR